MALLGLGAAARLCGRDVSTLHRAARRGTLAFSTDPEGRRVFDTSELERVYGKLATNAEAKPRIAAQPLKTAEDSERIADLRATIADLRQRLDASEAERRQLSERLAGLLSHRYPGSVPPVAAPQRRWWQRRR